MNQCLHTTLLAAMPAGDCRLIPEMQQEEALAAVR